MPGSGRGQEGGGGWHCCCCTVLDYDFCAECFAESIEQLDLWSDDRNGTWSCSTSGTCLECLMETTGDGRIVSRVNVTTNHMALMMPVRAPEPGETIGLIVGWKDACNYIEITYTPTSATTATAKIIQHTNCVVTVLTECEIDDIYGGHSGGIMAYVYDDEVKANTPNATLYADVSNVGHRVGFWHQTATPMGYTAFQAAELDPPEWQPRPEFCLAPSKCRWQDWIIGETVQVTLLNGNGCQGLEGYTDVLNRFAYCRETENLLFPSCLYESECPPRDPIYASDDPPWFPFFSWSPSNDGDPTLSIWIMRTDEANCPPSNAASYDSLTPIATSEPDDPAVWWLYRWEVVNGYNGLTGGCTQPTCAACTVDILITRP